MGKTKQSAASAAQRRAQTRELRQQRLDTTSTTTRQPRSKRRVQKKTPPWVYLVGVVGIVVVIVGVFVYLANQQSQTPTTATPTVFKEAASISPSILASVNLGSVQTGQNSILAAARGNPSVQMGPNGKPQVFYMGGEFCPYCAAQRWSMIIALSRFGTFEKPLTPIVASEGDVPTYTFHNGVYHSPYIDFVPVEVNDQNHQTLETLTPAEQQIVNKYDAPPYTAASATGSFPFISIGNQYVSSGAFFDYNLLVNHTHQDIVNQAQDPTTDISKGMLGAANYMTAAICKVTNNQPGDVCNSDPIPQIQPKLPAASASTGGQIAGNGGPVALLERRRY